MKWMMIIPIFLFSFYVSAKTFCIAHRGHHETQTENSMGALRSALEIGSDGVEFDIVHTKDGMPIIMHDLKLGDTTMARPEQKCPEKKIANLTWKEIQAKCLLKNGEEVPTLLSFLSVLKDTGVFVFIEFKDLPQFYTLQLIDQYLGKSAERVRFISFKQKLLDQAFAYRNDFPSFKNIKGLYNYRFFSKPKSAYNLNARFGYGRVRRIMKKEYEQFEKGIWTVDDPGKMIWADFMQVNFITSNRPELCLRLIRH
ncbi:MAG: hypothetical protein A2X86_21135 [Bdellovibrionales bacterium GWA2_49_15]|nr:MAG: hypothetical protein A2X86_21135 [Bdellovibrionales bacterium GWA2_49_15]HAZ14883.1 hypothetical protein [Bdellovibrionales bacterium]